MSKSWRLVEIARETFKARPGLDLSRTTSEFGKTIHPCKSCVSTAMPLCHWPCSCYPNYALGQTHDWMNEIYPLWVAAHGILLVTPVNWYQVRPAQGHDRSSGLLACECPTEGLQAGRRRHGGVQKNFALRVAEIRATLSPGTPVEVWFQDEMRVGQKNKLTYRWARKGSRPRAIHDQRTQSTYLFGAVCPERGAGAALVLPACNTEAMQLHLDEIATKVTPGAHAVLILDQAGWHGAKDLKAPKNISLLPLPPRAPELNPQENIWQFMRANWLSNRIFKSFDEIVDHCCYAWNTLIDRPWKIMSIARRDWAVAGHSL